MNCHILAVKEVVFLLVVNPYQCGCILYYLWYVPSLSTMVHSKCFVF